MRMAEGTAEMEMRKGGNGGNGGKACSRIGTRVERDSF